VTKFLACARERITLFFMAQEAKKTITRRRKGAMTVAEAGRKGGLAVRDKRGHEFYEEIGRKGGRKVRALIAAGKRALGQKG
jgi:general stress protein YciG